MNPELLDASAVNPVNLGLRPDIRPVKPGFQPEMAVTRLLEVVGKKKNPSLTPEELSDLLLIDPRNVTLDKIKNYAYVRVWEYESRGNVRYTGAKLRYYREAKQLVNWLDHEEYAAAAGYFLMSARKIFQIGGKIVEKPDSSGEVSARYLDIDKGDLVMPEIVRRSGDTAILNFLEANDRGIRVIKDNGTYPMYLRQAAVLARIISEKGVVKNRSAK